MKNETVKFNKGTNVKYPSLYSKRKYLTSGDYLLDKFKEFLFQLEEF